MKKLIPFLMVLFVFAAGCNKSAVNNQNDDVVGFMKQSLNETYGFDKSMIAINVTDREADFAKGTIEMGVDKDLPSNFLIYKDQGEWKVAQEWSSDFYCPDIEGFNFPQNMTQGCIKPDEEFTVADARGIQSAFADMYHENVENITVRVDQYDANHARGTVEFNNSDNSGGMFLAAKVDGVWDIIIDGNQNFKCEFLAPYDFSDAMSSGCSR